MYRLGDMYQTLTLCNLAIMKFTESATKLWSLTNKIVSGVFVSMHAFEAGDSIEHLTKAIRMAYSSTPDTNRGMRNAITMAILGNYHYLVDLEKIRLLIREELPAFGADLFLMLHERSRVAQQPFHDCQMCAEPDTMPHTFVVARACAQCYSRL